MIVCNVELFFVCCELLFRIVQAIDEPLFHGDCKVEMFFSSMVQVSLVGSFQGS